VLGCSPGTVAVLVDEARTGTGPEPVGLLRDRLARLAEHAPAPRGAATAVRVVADVRSHRRRAVAWAAAVLAIGGVLAAVPSTVSGLSPGSAADAGADGGAGAGAGVARAAAGDAGPSLYDLAPRGSLAGDAEFLAGVREIPWDGPEGGPGPAAGTRRVLFAGDVPGGSRWALVMGRVGPQLVYAWFTGPAGAAPGELVLVGAPARAGAEQPIALLDAGGATGPLVVVGRPGDRAGYSPSLDRDASGELGRTYTELPVVDGVPLGEVDRPRAYGAGQVRVLRETGPLAIVEPTVVDDPRSSVPVGPGPDQDPRRYWVELRDCLAPLGFQVTLDPAGTGLSWSGGPALTPDVGWPSSAEQAENDAAFDRCRAQVAGG
jgi:hypothetical protein